MLDGDARGHLVGALKPPLAVVTKAEGESVGELGGVGRPEGSGISHTENRNRTLGIRVEGSSVGRRDLEGCLVNAFSQVLPIDVASSHAVGCGLVVRIGWFRIDSVRQPRAAAPTECPMRDPYQKEGSHEEAREASVGRDDVL